MVHTNPPKVRLSKKAIYAWGVSFLQKRKERPVNYILYLTKSVKYKVKLTL